MIISIKVVILVIQIAVLAVEVFVVEVVAYGLFLYILVDCIGKVDDYPFEDYAMIYCIQTCNIYYRYTQHPFIYLSGYLSICLCIYLSNYLSIQSSIYTRTHTPIHCKNKYLFLLLLLLSFLLHICHQLRS